MSVASAALVARSRRHALFAAITIPVSCAIIYLGMPVQGADKTPYFVALGITCLAQFALAVSSFVAAVAARRTGNSAASWFVGILLALGAVVGGFTGFIMMAFGHTGRGY